MAQLLYGLETVVLTKAQERKLEVTEMLRSSLSLIRMDRVKNEEVRKRMKVGSFQDKVREACMRWYGHVLRREEAYVRKRTQRLMVGKRVQERPKIAIEKTWMCWVCERKM